MKKLREINIQDNKEIDEIAILKDQKNQLEIEKNQINKFIESLEQENLKLKNQINELKKDYEISKEKKINLQKKLMN